MCKEKILRILVSFLLYGGWGGLCTYPLCITNPGEISYKVDGVRTTPAEGVLQIYSLKFFYILCFCMIIAGFSLLLYLWKKTKNE